MKIGLALVLIGEIGMNVFDFHTHIYPEKIAHKATQSVCDFYKLNSSLTGTAEELIDDGKKAGISKFLILPVAIRADQVRGINEFVAGEVKNHEEFYGFGTVHAQMNDICQEVEKIKELGLLGVKMHPDTQKFNIDDERLFPMYDLIQGQLPVMLHAGDPRYSYSHPARIRKIIKMFPKLTVIAAHFGGWSVFDEAYENLKDTDCYMDVSSSLMFMSHSRAERYISKYGADRMLFGSDYPLWSPAAELDAFMKLNLTGSDQERILYENAINIIESIKV